MAALCIVTIIFRAENSISGKADSKVMYEDPDNLEKYIPKNDQDIELKQCPAYEKPTKQPDIELEECPAYLETKKERSDIKLEECPAYVETKQSDIKLEECPAYGVSNTQHHACR